MSTFATRIATVETPTVNDSTPTTPAIWWYNGNKPAKTPGIFYVKGTALQQEPTEPWAPSQRFEHEVGFETRALHLALITWRQQPYHVVEIVSGGEKRKDRRYIAAWEPGAQIHTEIVCLAEGIAEPVVWSFHSMTGHAVMGETGIFNAYRNGLLREAEQIAGKRLPLWTFWLPISKPHRKGRKAQQITPTRTQPCRLDPATLPPDAVRRDTTITVVQDLRLALDIVAFERETWYAPSTDRTSTAPLPPGYDGSFGPHIRSLAVVLAHVTLVSEPQILQLFTTAGIQVSAGTIHAWVTHVPASLHAERDAVVAAGLKRSPWQQIDDTPTSVNRRQHTCHVLGNPLYTAYRTHPSKNRLAVLTTLLNGQALTFRLNDDTCLRLTVAGVSPTLLTHLRQALPWDVALTADELAMVLPRMGTQTRQRVLGQLAIAAYHAQTDIPIVRLLLCDDAPQFHQLVDDLALCWIHEGRHLALLTPLVPRHQHLLRRVRRHFWAYYHALLAYRARPDPDDRIRLEQSFMRLVLQRTGYGDLDARLALLASKRESLLHVLDHPERPLHNNAMELGARRRVRKRDVSFGPRSDAGVRAWDTCMTLVATAQKLGVNVIASLHDRISGVMQLPSRADVLTERARTADLGASWAAT